ncbi:hypothetical protein B0H17DRAFT_1186551 [Mycena rosella]|uniref:Uncharacterized protein n=1 Tax=Mycena rosella TaxID=1033263 RepID=A0AAD7FZP4_MYCRO|nr:hypothetical protein B0H17DRAFT_1186551 [Mycena rosella]
MNLRLCQGLCSSRDRPTLIGSAVIVKMLVGMLAITNGWVGLRMDGFIVCIWGRWHVKALTQWNIGSRGTRQNSCQGARTDIQGYGTTED